MAAFQSFFEASLLSFSTVFSTIFKNDLFKWFNLWRLRFYRVMERFAIVLDTTTRQQPCQPFSRSLCSVTQLLVLELNWTLGYNRVDERGMFLFHIFFLVFQWRRFRRGRSAAAVRWRRPASAATWKRTTATVRCCSHRTSCVSAFLPQQSRFRRNLPGSSVECALVRNLATVE